MLRLLTLCAAVGVVCSVGVVAMFGWLLHEQIDLSPQPARHAVTLNTPVAEAPTVERPATVEPATSIAPAPQPPSRPAAAQAEPAKPKAAVLDLPTAHFPDDIADPDGSGKKSLSAPWEQR